VKYSIIMPYHRKRTLHNTLLSYLHHYSGRKDYEVLVMEDCKNIADGDEHRALQVIIKDFAGKLNIRRVETHFENSYAPSRIFNMGADHAKGDFLVLTSPECFHITGVLDQFDRILAWNPDAYITASCFSTDDNGIVQKFGNFKPKREIWLDHPQHLNRNLYWCAVISKPLYRKVGGIDEGYAPGFGREDVDFVRTVKAAGIMIVARDDILVAHQNHPDFSSRKRELHALNAKYYAKKWRGK